MQVLIIFYRDSLLETSSSIWI